MYIHTVLLSHATYTFCLHTCTCTCTCMCTLLQAVNFLHECGVLLHYDDVKSKLSQLFFLDPEWLCSLMAQIITVTEVNPLVDRQGVSRALISLSTYTCTCTYILADALNTFLTSITIYTFGKTFWRCHTHK